MVQQARLTEPCLLGEGLEETHPAHDYMVERYERIRARILRNLRQAEKLGEIEPGTDLAALSAIVVAVMDGLQFQWLLNPDLDMVRSFGVFKELISSQLVEPAATDPSDDL